MREMIVIRLHDYQTVGDIPEYVLEINLPGRYEKHHVGGASQVELLEQLADSLADVLGLLGVPGTVVRPEPVPPVEPEFVMSNDGNGGLEATSLRGVGKASFEAQVIRGGKVVEE
jgi:hypothetical protein